MRIGLNGMGDAPLPPNECDFIASWGPMTVRAGVTTADGAAWVLDTCDKTTPRPIQCLFLVQGIEPALVQDLGAVLRDRTDVGIELGNELNLAGVAPTDFGAFVLDSYTKLRDLGYRGEIWSGGLSDCRQSMLDYLTTAGVQEWPSDLGCAMHRYPEDPWTQDPTIGQGPTRSAWDKRERWREQADLMALLGNRPLAITEFGYHYELQHRGHGERREATQLTEAQGAARLACDLWWFSQMNVQLATMYQWTDGDPADFNQAIARFGIRKSDGTFRELVIEVLSAWASR
jgi:hypothetical protein